MYKVISLFSGAGGSTEGYKQAGYNVIAAVEFVDYQANNYRLNHSGKIYEDDIRKIDPINILNDFNIKVGELDILDGSPPCASFSTAGKRSKLWGKEKIYSNKKQRTDDLFYEYIRFLEIMKPKIFVAENVSGLIKGVAKGKFNQILNEFRKLDYNVKCKVLNSKYYGVPQSRERVIFIGVRKDLDIDPCFPDPDNNIITIKKAFENLPKENKIQSDFLINQARYYIKGWYGILLKIPKNPSKVLKGSKYANGSYFNLSRLSYNAPSDTICQMNGEKSASGNCHPIYDRKLTIYEVKRICGFPDDYKLEGSFKQQWEAMGRSVPPPLIKSIAKTIKEKILDKTKV